MARVYGDTAECAGLSATGQMKRRSQREDVSSFSISLDTHKAIFGFPVYCVRLWNVSRYTQIETHTRTH